jgi:hypothetical protein
MPRRGTAQVLTVLEQVKLGKYKAQRRAVTHAYEADGIAMTCGIS